MRMKRSGEAASGTLWRKYPRYTQRTHNTLSAQWVDSAEVVAVSTDAQRSSSQQGINLFLKGNMKAKENSFVVEVVAVDFVVRSRLCSSRLLGNADELDCEEFPTNFHT
jgi:hypothetical protein